MNIGINVSPLKNGETMTGISNYIFQIVKCLIANDSRNHYYLFANDDLQVHFDEKPNVHIIRCKSIGTKKLFWGRYLLGLQLSKYHLDVFWSPIHHLPLFRQRNTRYFITIHDVADFKLKGTSAEDFSFLGSWKKKYLEYIAASSCKFADGVIAVSQATKNDIAELWRIDLEKISVIYEGGIEDQISNLKIPDSKFAETIKKYGIRKPYFLYVGTLQPRKNIATIVDAFLLLKQEQNCNAQMVLAGGTGWGMDEVLQKIEKSPAKADIILTGYISDDEKYALYRNAVAFVFPSLYEGFGIPILEAFHYGLPVITANNSALPEVGGDAAFYLQNEKSSMELKKMMQKMLFLSMKELEEIKSMERKQMSKFGWGGGVLFLCKICGLVIDFQKQHTFLSFKLPVLRKERAVNG